jgi:hypothetical protein
MNVHVLVGSRCEHERNMEMTVVLFESMSVHDAFSCKAIELFSRMFFEGHYPKK